MEHTRTYLTTHNLEVGYRKGNYVNRLFTNLDLSLNAGEMICFMGPNGAGKSSLLRTLAGLQEPLSGQIELHHVSASRQKEHQIAVVLTDSIRSANLTVREVVTFGRYPYLGWNIRLTTEDEEIVERSIEQIRLQPLLEKKLYELSDGQLQMVMIARALAQDTHVILLDEPTAHLDLNNRVEMMNLLRLLSRTTGKAILLATHELDLALQTADLIWLTGKDRNILRGLPEDLVLNESFDEIFKFKGFDLKTGKMSHDPFRNIEVGLRGEGSAFLWTKNALERSGYRVTTGDPGVVITLVQDSAHLKWVIKKSGTEIESSSIENLMKSL